MLDLPDFPSYQIDRRLKELHRLGLSSPVVRLAMFDLPDTSFLVRCNDVGPPCPEWRDQQPAGAPVSYLWCYGETVTGARLNVGWANLLRNPRDFSRKQVEFIKFKPNALATGYVIIAYHEQGLLANLFSDMIGDLYGEWEIYVMGSSPPDISRDQFEAFQRESLMEAAQSVGFRYFEEVELFWHAHMKAPDYGELLAAYTRSIR